MSGFLALLDDVVAITKVAAASLDDVMMQAAKAGSKAAGAVIDDAAVTPRYLHGFDAHRELPVIWKIAKGSFKNKLFFLLPAGLLLNTFAPWMIPPLLILGGMYLCFEGAEKIWHAFVRDPEKAGSNQADPDVEPINPVHLEEHRVAGAIKTDFILSAEIMTISLAAIPASNIWMEAATLGVVGIGITVVVYGSVAVIVKADDVGLFISQNGRFAATRAIGTGLVRMMPGFLTWLSRVGTAAMLWVGGSIVVHGLKELGFGWLGYQIQGLAGQAGLMVSEGYTGLVTWSATAAMDGVLGLALGLALIPIVTRVLVPAWSALRRS